jgi:uncharacterized Tic20 family protein
MAGYPQQQMPGYPAYPGGNVQGYGPRGPADDQVWAMLSYLLGFVAALIAPLIIYLIKMNESRYVRYHAAQSLNMAITGFIYAFGGAIIGIFLAIASHGLALLLLIPLFLIYVVAHVIFLILGAIAAYRGELTKIPAVICLPLVR